MSHRITTKSSMKDPRLIRKALEIAKMNYEEKAGVFRITSGSHRSATIDSQTGIITGDSDWHGGILGDLRQNYAEAQHLEQLRLAGCEVEERTVLRTGQVQLICRGTIAG